MILFFNLMQDLLGLGSESRMNTPSTTENNWVWRMPAGYSTAAITERLAGLIGLFDRAGRG